MDGVKLSAYEFHSLTSALKFRAFALKCRIASRYSYSEYVGEKRVSLYVRGPYLLRCWNHENGIRCSAMSVIQLTGQYLQPFPTNLNSDAGNEEGDKSHQDCGTALS